MKRKRGQQQERRRPLADLNLIGDGKRLQVRRKGCFLFGSVLLLSAAAVSIGLGLH